MDPQSLLLFFALRQPRRIRVIENILAGHKTVSNLYWGMRYGLLNYLGALKSVSKAQDQQSLEHLLETGNLATSDRRNYLLTPKGYQAALQLRQSWYLPKFLKYNLNYDLNRFKARFVLAVQVVSEYSYHNLNYYPVQIDYRDATLVKQWFHYAKDNHLIIKCYRSLGDFFKRLDQLDSTLGWQAANLLVGHNSPGQTISQQSRQLHQPLSEIMFRQIDILGALVATLVNRPNVFSPLLNGLRTSPLSSSARKTFELACRSLTFSQICRIQSLRISTVKEHLLSVAIFLKVTKFPFGNFISKPLMNKLSKLYRGDPDHWDYAKYKSVTGNDLDFFYFRLFQILRSKQHE